jgi:hypothetical protein
LKIAPRKPRGSLFAFFYGLDAPCAPTKGDETREFPKLVAKGEAGEGRFANGRSNRFACRHAFSCDIRMVPGPIPKKSSFALEGGFGRGHFGIVVRNTPKGKEK